MHSDRSRGFILVIVIGMLGSMAFLSLSYSKVATLSKTLSTHLIHRSHLDLLTRSGVEKGFAGSLERIKNGLLEPGTTEICLFDGVQTHWSFSMPLNVMNSIDTYLKDASGCININDGIEAGKIELGSDYNSQALDPWPEELVIYDSGPEGEVSHLTGEIVDQNGGFTADLKDEYVRIFENAEEHGFARIIDVDTSSGTRLTVHPVLVSSTGYEIIRTDRSALANLRLRRLLNAYGDVHRRIAELGWPTWSGDPVNDPTWGMPTTFTSSATEDRPHSIPGGKGLGDLIISNRPQEGYRQLSSIKDMVNEWGATHLKVVNEDYLKEKNFFELIRGDLTLVSFSDSEFFKMKREFGIHKTRTYNRIYIPELMHLEDSLVDLDNIWQRHPINLINLNAASLVVLSATFYAPTNVGYSYQSGRKDKFTLHFDPGNNSSFDNLSPGITVTSPVFRSDSSENYVTENGLDTYVQKNRLMSLRDAMVTAQGYKHYGSEIGFPDSFTSFADLLYKLREGEAGLPTMHDYERALEDKEKDHHIPHYPGEQGEGASTTHSSSGSYETDLDSYYFRQTYIEKTLPHIFSCIRRMPSWMNAPLALTSPYLRPKSVSNTHLYGLYSVEDFVFRFHLPKVCFTPCGVFKTLVEAKLVIDGNTMKDSMSVNFRSFETKYFRSQSSFEDTVDTVNSDQRFKIGPEFLPGGDKTMGVIGLNDRRSTLFNRHPYGAIHNFDEISELSSEALLPQEVVFPVIDSEQEYYLSPVTVVVEGRYPDPYGDPTWNVLDPQLPETHPFDANFFTAIRSDPSLHPNLTWLQVKSEQQIGVSVKLRLIPLLGGPTAGVFLMSQSELIAAVTPIWNTTIGANGSPPPSSATMDQLAWELVRQQSTVGIHWFDSSDPNNSILKEEWTNGEPGPQINSEADLGNSNLNGFDHSVFSRGSLASGLSPYNGVSFSSIGHGLRATKKFSNSLFYRPYALIDPGYLVNNGLAADLDPNDNLETGSQFNRGMISFWFKVPVDHQVGDRCLFHLNLWESADVSSFTSYAMAQTIFPPETQIRSNQIYAYLSPDYNGSELFVGHASVGRYDDLVDWSNDIGLSNVPYPSGPTLQSINYNFIGGPPTDNSMEVSLSDPVGYWFYSGTVLEGYKTTPDLVSGQWYRLMVGWDYTQVSSDPNTRFWAKILNRPGSINNLSREKEEVKKLISSNKQMLLSFGEVPVHVEPSLLINSSAAFHPNGIEPHRSYPFMRLNSSIDNIDIRFGHSTNNSQWFGFPLTTPPDVSDVADMIEDTTHDYYTWRYDINSLNSQYPISGGYSPEPKLSLDLSNKIGASGKILKVISIGSRIYDCPSGPVYNPSPAVEVNIENPLGNVVSTVYESNEETPGVLFHQNSEINTHSSKSLKTFINTEDQYLDLADINSRLTVIYKKEAPDGTEIKLSEKTLSNIPWIKEISCRYRTSDKSVIMNWDTIN